MNRYKAKQLISEALHQLDIVNRCGGAENAPAIWQRFTLIRAELFREMELPEASYYTKILTTPYYFSEKRNRVEQTISFSGIRNEMADNGIDASDDFKCLDLVREAQIKYIYDHLLEDSEVFEFVSKSKSGFLSYSATHKVPVNDVLLILKIDDSQYVRFLINTILYGRYASTWKVFRELMKLKKPEIQFQLYFYESGRIEDRQVAAEWLRISGLKFIDQFLWLDDIAPVLDDHSVQ
jgi:hypothetical protein